MKIMDHLMTDGRKTNESNKDSQMGQVTTKKYRLVLIFTEQNYCFVSKD
jgi:hypothetical protein